MTRLELTRNGSPMTASSATKRRSLYVIACALLFSAPALAQVAPPEMAVAEQSVQQATQADADQYAPDLVNLARQELLQSQQAAADRHERKQAPRLALRAAADADLARARSDEAVVQAQLAQRRAEVAKLQNSLNVGGK